MFFFCGLEVKPFFGRCLKEFCFFFGGLEVKRLCFLMSFVCFTMVFWCVCVCVLFFFCGLHLFCVLQCFLEFCNR